MPRVRCFHSGCRGVSMSRGRCGAMAYLILWEFRPRPGKEPEFETAYGPGGDWARLFRRSGEYLGTHLLRDVGDPCRYFTLDRTSRGAFEDFRRFHRSDYLE